MPLFTVLKNCFWAFLLTALSISHAEDSSLTIKVAAVQFQPRGSAEVNTEIIIRKLQECAQNDVRVALFSECAITGYDKKVINSTTASQLQAAERRIALACKNNNIYAIVGAPYDSNGVRYNTAAVYSPAGKIIHRYAKIQLVGGDDWAVPGTQMAVFYIDDIPCSIIICHDERYPELTRLPVLAGARLVFYPSSESPITAEKKLIPYRYQICARADENDIYIVHSNNPAMMSHGQSRIIGPDGNIIAEAGMFTEEIIMATLNMHKATGKTAINSLRYGELKEWWQNGMAKVIVKKP